MSSTNDDTKLTSVKIIKDLYTKFKKATLDEKITLQQFVNRSLNLYIDDVEFKKRINEYDTLKLTSGSYF
jgi:hypothetical protein